MRFTRVKICFETDIYNFRLFRKTISKPPKTSDTSTGNTSYPQCCRIYTINVWVIWSNFRRNSSMMEISELYFCVCIFKRYFIAKWLFSAFTHCFEVEVSVKIVLSSVRSPALRQVVREGSSFFVWKHLIRKEKRQNCFRWRKPCSPNERRRAGSFPHDRSVGAVWAESARRSCSHWLRRTASPASGAVFSLKSWRESSKLFSTLKRKYVCPLEHFLGGK